MRFVIWLILLFVVAAVSATVLGGNDGLVTLYLPPWRIDLSFNLFVLISLATAMTAYTMIRAVSLLLGMPERAREWRVNKRDRNAQAALRDAMAQHFAGRYTRAQRSAQRAIDIWSATPDLAVTQDNQALAHMLAAASSHRLQDRTHRDAYLKQALQEAGRGKVLEEGARLLEAEWALDDREAGRALQLLSDLPTGVARRTLALRLKLQAQRQAGHPLDALRTARLLAKHQGFSAVAAKGLLRSLAVEALTRAKDVDQLRSAWLGLEPADRRDAHVAAKAARLAADMGQHDDARGWLRPFWDDLDRQDEEARRALAGALLENIRGIGGDWLQRLEHWVQELPRDAELALAWASCLRELRLWGKAKAEFERLAERGALPELLRRQAWVQLAELAEQAQDEAEASRCYKEAARVGLLAA